MNSSFFLRIQGFFLGTLHFSGALLALIASIDTNNFNTLFPLHYSKGIWIDCKNLTHERINVIDDTSLRLRIRDFCSSTKSVKAMTYTDNVWFDAPFGWLIMGYFLWTAIFHFFYVTVYWKTYMDKVVNAGERLRIRWLEYAVSASIMFFIISYFFGHTNIMTLCLLSLIVYFVIFIPFFISAENNYSGVYVTACLAYSLVWLYLILSFLIEQWDYLSEIPWYVYVILMGEFVLFNLFPGVFYLEYKSIKRGETNLVKTETMYNVLSAASKFLLGIIFGFFIFML